MADVTGDVIRVLSELGLVQASSDGGITPGVQLSVDSSGNTVLVRPDGVMDDLRLKPQASIDGRFVAGQPIGITRPVRNTGKLLCRFRAADWVAYGAATLADHTGYDASGNVTGVVSRTGHPQLLKVTAGDDSNEGVVQTNFASIASSAAVINGLVGLWVYVETQPGYGAGEVGGSQGSLIIDLSTTTGFANHLSVTFNPNVLKEGWNFLVFRMRNFNAYVTGSGVSETHPFGVYAIAQGTGAAANILAAPIAAVRMYWNGPGITGKNIYLDSMWTGFDVQAQLVIGYDTSDQTIIDYALPIYDQYGWKSYFTINGAYWDGVASRILADYTNNSGSYPTRIATLKAAGWDAINHGLQHLPGYAASPNMQALTDPAEIAYEVMAVHGVNRSLGLTRGTEFYAAPQNSSSRLTEKVIEGCGFKLQRASRGHFNPVTPWGVPNTKHLGSFGLGATNSSAYNVTTGNVVSAVTLGAGGIGNLQKCKNVIDTAEAYGATLIAYAHGLETAGDDGTGNSTPASSENCVESLNRLFLEYAKQKEDSGLLRVCDGFTGFYYGVGR